jgi:hypothetical protein
LTWYPILCIAAENLRYAQKQQPENAAPNHTLASQRGLMTPRPHRFNSDGIRVLCANTKGSASELKGLFQEISVIESVDSRNRVKL